LCLPARPYDFRAKPTHIVATFNMRSYVSGATGTGIELPVAYQHQSASAPTPPPHKKTGPPQGRPAKIAASMHHLYSTARARSNHHAQPCIAPTRNLKDNLMSKAILTAAIAQSAGLSTQNAQAATNAVIETILTELKSSGGFAVPGFGAFRVTQTGPRAGRNPATGAAIQIPASRTVRFKPSATLREELMLMPQPAAQQPAAQPATQPANSLAAAPDAAPAPAPAPRSHRAKAAHAASPAPSAPPLAAPPPTAAVANGSNRRRAAPQPQQAPAA